jgi:hypothetical protein
MNLPSINFQQNFTGNINRISDIAKVGLKDIKEKTGMNSDQLIGMGGNLIAEPVLKKVGAKALAGAFDHIQEPLMAIDLADPYNYNMVPTREGIDAQAKTMFQLVENMRKGYIDDIYKKTYGTNGPTGAYSQIDKRIGQMIPHYYTIKHFTMGDLGLDQCEYINMSNFIDDQGQPIQLTPSGGSNPLIPYQFMLNTANCPTGYQSYYQDYYIKNHPDTQILDCQLNDGYLDLVTYTATSGASGPYISDLSRATTSCSLNDSDGKYYQYRYRVVLQNPQNGGKECPTGTVDNMYTETIPCPSQDCSYKTDWYHNNYDSNGNISGTSPDWSDCFQSGLCSGYHSTGSLSDDDQYYYNLFNCNQKKSDGTYDTSQWYQIRTRDVLTGAKNGGNCDSLQIRSNYDPSNTVCQSQDCALIGDWYHNNYNSNGNISGTGPDWSNCFQSGLCSTYHSTGSLSNDDQYYYKLFNCDQKKSDGTYDTSQWYQMRQKVVSVPAKQGGKCDSVQIRSNYDTSSTCKPVNCSYSDWSSTGSCGLFNTTDASTFHKPPGWYTYQTRQIQSQSAYGGIQCSSDDLDYVRLSECNKNDCVLSDWKTTDCYIDSTDGKYKRMKYKSVVQQATNGGSCTGPIIQYESCPTKNCAVSPDWSNWSNCSLSPDGKTFVRYRSKSVLQQPSAGQQCSPLLQQETCQPQNCQVGNWSDWSSCYTNNVGQRIQTRVGEILTPSLYGGTSCPDLNQYRSC